MFSGTKSSKRLAKAAKDLNGNCTTKSQMTTVYKEYESFYIYTTNPLYLLFYIF